MVRQSGISQEMTLHNTMPEIVFRNWLMLGFRNCSFNHVNDNNNMQFLYSTFSLPKLAQSALHIITPGRPVASITC